MDDHSLFLACCVKRICHGCNIAAQKRGMVDCPFCRTPFPVNDADKLAMIMVRVKKKDPHAIAYLGDHYFHGHFGLQKNVHRAIELYTEVAELGSIESLNKLGLSHDLGRGVRNDEKRAVQFYEKAAMQGCALSRHNIGSIEMNNGKYGRAVRHHLIAAKMGYEASLEMIKKMYMDGDATKAHYAEALKGYQGAVEEMKSPDREEARKFLEALEALEAKKLFLDQH